MKNQANSASANNIDGVHVWLVLWKAYDAVYAHASRSIESLNMCLTDFGILELLLHKGPASINALGEKLSLASGSATAAIDRLERRGLAQRVASPTDRRVKVVELTAAGKQLIKQAFEQHSQDLEQAAAPLSARERTTLLNLLKKLGRSAAHLTDKTIEEI